MKQRLGEQLRTEINRCEGIVGTESSARAHCKSPRMQCTWTSKPPRMQCIWTSKHPVAMHKDEQTYPRLALGQSRRFRMTLGTLPPTLTHRTTPPPLLQVVPSTCRCHRKIDPYCMGVSIEFPLHERQLAPFPLVDIVLH